MHPRSPGVHQAEEEDHPMREAFSRGEKIFSRATYMIDKAIRGSIIFAGGSMT